MINDTFRPVTAINISFIVLNELKSFVNEIDTDNLTVSNSELITLDFTVSEIGFP